MKSVCFCFPFFFDFDGAIASAAVSAPSSWAGVAEPDDPPAFGLQAEASGVLSPIMFFSDWFPRTAGFCLVELDEGSPGNRELESGAGGRGCPPGPFLRASARLAPGPGTDAGKGGPGADVGARMPPEELADQGVVLLAFCLKVWTGAGAKAGCKGGKLGGGRGAGTGARAEEDDGPAAWATRSHS